MFRAFESPSTDLECGCASRRAGVWTSSMQIGGGVRRVASASAVWGERGKRRLFAILWAFFCGRVPPPVRDRQTELETRKGRRSVCVCEREKEHQSGPGSDTFAGNKDEKNATKRHIFKRLL